MKDFYITYPNYTTKSFTASFDDCVVQDKDIIEIAVKYGVCVTFAIQTNCFGHPGSWMEHIGHQVWIQRPKDENDFKTWYMHPGLEIATHSYSHPPLAELETEEELYREVYLEQLKLEALTGQKVLGICYPSSSYNNYVIERLKSYGLIYGRTADSSLSYELPDDFMIWKPTCHEEYANMLCHVQQMEADPRKDLLCYYVWGHAYELDKPALVGKDRRENLEKLFAYVGASDKIWCATNGQIATYVLATRKNTLSEDCYCNNSEQTIYAIHKELKITIAPGEKYMLNQ